MPDEQKQSGVRAEIAHLLSDDQDPAAVEQILEKVSDLLTTDEKVEYICVQKNLVVNPRPDAMVLTNRRFIVFRPKIMGRVSFVDQSWRDLKDVHLEEGVVGATIKLATTSGSKIEIGFLPKNQARKVYALAQEQEERVREERRRRELEEMRASAGGITMNQPGAAATQSTSQDPVERLSKLKQLLDAGLISPGEFEAKRAEIIDEM